MQLIISFRDENKSDQFLPILFSSQACESTFRPFRSMSTILRTNINMSLLGAFNAVGRIELQKVIRFFKIPDVKFAQSSVDIPLAASVLPANGTIFETVKAAAIQAAQ